MESEILSRIRSELISQADEKTREGSVRYFKEEIRVYGVKTALVSRIAAKYYPEIKSLTKTRVFELCEELWKSDYMEEAFIACEWSYRRKAEYEPGDFAVFERWIGSYVNNWAECDTLCNHSVGSLVEKFPVLVQDLKPWTTSENRWFRRAAAVTLIIPAKKGLFLDDILEIAAKLLRDKDDLVQKGYGWMLKEAAVPHLQEVYSFILNNKQNMPRTALRYAIEKMPDELKRRAMSK